MFPHLYEAHTAQGDLPLNTWGLMITLAFLLGSAVGHVRSQKVGLDPDRMTGFYIVALVAGLTGARLLHFLMATPEVFFKDPMVFLRVWEGGFAFYGGFILAGILGIAYAIRRGLDPWKLSDVTAPLVMLGLAIGRLGCFSAGCCHGRETILPPDAWGLFPASFAAAHGQLYVMAHPPFLVEITRHGVGENNHYLLATQLYEFFAAMAIFGITSWLWRRRRFDGEIVAAVLVLYAIWRPINESLRGDEIRGTDWFGMTTSQLLSIPMGALGLLIVLWRFRKGVTPETPFVAEDPLASGSAPRI